MEGCFRGYKTCKENLGEINHDMEKIAHQNIFNFLFSSNDISAS
jgi:hypothetical protein